MDVEANKALVRRFYEEVWARGNVAFTEEVFADDYVRHDLRPTKAPPGAAGQALIAEQFRRAFPDLEWRVDAVKTFLAIQESAEPEVDTDIGGVDGDDGDAHPDVLFTTLVGSKGLSAEHVFIVGFNNGHFPRNPEAITDDEVCKLLVALSRTRKRCHIISFGFFGKGFLPESSFAAWIRPHFDAVKVDAQPN